MTSQDITAQATPARAIDPEDEHHLVHAGDHWLDEVTAPSNPVFNPATHLAMSTFAGPARWFRRGYAFISTTPGKLFTVTLVLTIAIIAAGISMSNSSAQRQESLDVLLSRTEPMSNSAHNLYTSLSLADTIATTGFVQAGVESESNRKKYNEAIDRASVAASQAMLGTNEADQRSRDLVAFIQRQLPVYTAMVETARSNHRSGNSVASAYMSNASALMREEILPAAQELFRMTSTRVSNEQESLSAPQWVPLSGLLAAVAFLILAQWWLWRLTRRRLNPGFAIATGLLILAIVWVAVSNVATWTAGTRGFEDASRPWDSLTASRIEAQQTRTAETLALVRRQSAEDVDVTFEETITSINSALDEFSNSESINPTLSESRVANVEAAKSALRNWSTTHAQFQRALNTGDYEEAIYLSTSPTPDTGDVATSASAFTSLDNTLSKLIADSRQSMRSYIQDGLSAMRTVSTAVFLLTFAAVLATWFGIRPRLQEYL